MPARRTLRHPARLVPFAFFCAIVVGTVLLALPISKQGEGGAPLLTALFTATSAVCVTGLITVDTATYWSPFGHVMILLLIQTGGFGIMTLATLLGLLVSRRLGLATRLVAQAETKTLALGEVRRVLGRIALTILTVEAVVAALLTLRFHFGYAMSAGDALWHGVFHSISSFNNAGFALYSDNMIGFVDDPWICLPLVIGVVLGGIGFPVLFELRRELHMPRRWTTHTKITVYGSLVLLSLGTLAVLVLEWANPRTLGRLDVAGKLLASFFHGAMPRTAGFNAIDYADAEPATLAVTDALMFIGGGSAGTAGGVKVTTFFLLAFVIWTEVRGETDVNVFRRRLGAVPQRQALTVALLGVAVVAFGTLTLLVLTEHSMDAVLFEVISAFATVGLSTGITGTLPAGAQLVLVMLMFVGRVGTITVGTALALRTRHRLYRLPEERTIVG
ncbi:MAG: TrkH family potassium uptake protein [Micromonosporaceae bacterium]